MAQLWVSFNLHKVYTSVIFQHTLHLGGSDYSSIGSIDLTFDRDTSAFPILVDILDDQIHELDENFLGELTTSDEDAILSPSQTTVRILDNDGNDTAYTVVIWYNAIFQMF